ncbi:MAG: glycosyltransferase [Candidatus Veblenbacteria bacterium]|nr:glycosyltransferase [Candidatus Veblenbacteria bacterium]MDZ4230149.1 glycosyltransferase [Candidatus Veblenbacteria bacterium]
MVSLIIPTLNEADSLPKVLRGLSAELKRQYNVEVIVSDGGSVDATLSLARSLGARVVEAVPGVPQTIASGRDAGAGVARGDVLLFMDADTYPKSWAELLAAAVRVMQDSRTVAATMRFGITPSERRWYDALWQESYNLLFALQNYLGFGIGRGNCQIVQAAIFRAVGGYDSHLAAAEDYDLYRRLRKQGRIRFLWGVVVYESPRRFRHYGYVRVSWWWFLNAWSVLLRHRSWSKKWKRVQ